jgi:nucleotide-binding universal stress UspA family protein
MRDADFDVLRKLADRRALPEALRDELDIREMKMPAPKVTSGPGGGSSAALPSLGLVEAVGHQVLDRAHAAAKKAGAKKVAAVLLSGDAADAILDYAKRKKVDLIVLGTLGFGDFRSVVLGTVSHKIGSRAHCSCLTVR